MDRLVDLWLQIPSQRRNRLILILFFFIFLGCIFWSARNVLSPFILGLSVAYLLSPVVKLIQQGFDWIAGRSWLGFLKPAARPLAILMTYLLLIALLVGFFALFVPIVVEQAKALWEARLSLWENLTKFGEGVMEQYQLLPEQVRGRVEENLTQLNRFIGEAVEKAATSTAGAISYTVSLLLGVLIIPFWTFYLLKDARELRQSALDLVPINIRLDVLRMLELMDKVLGSYLRGQLLLGLIIGSVSAIGLTFLGVRYALLLGVIAGIFELIPNIGPLLGAIPALVVALTQDPKLGLAVAIFAFAIQQLENLFLTPRIIGQSVSLHPVLIMVVLIVGSELGGILGLFLAPLATAILRDTFRYLYYRFSDEGLSPDEALERVFRREKISLRV